MKEVKPEKDCAKFAICFLRADEANEKHLNGFIELGLYRMPKDAKQARYSADFFCWN